MNNKMPIVNQKHIEKWKRNIFNVIAKEEDGIPIGQIATKLKASRDTIRKYIMALEGEGKIYLRRVGNVSLYKKKVNEDGNKKK